MSETDKDRLRLFLDEYIRICKRYNLIIESCGCCQSPWISDVSDKFGTGLFSRGNFYTYREYLEKSGILKR